MCMREDLLDNHDPIELSRNSIVSWRQFTTIMREYQISESSFEQAALFLRHLGVIHHFRDVSWELKDLASVQDMIFINPSM